MLSTQIIITNSTAQVNYISDIDLGEFSFCSVAVASQSGSVEDTYRLHEI